ncbi:MAG: polysaccharide biosynthesis/export family protein [Acidobacteria bacterium]|nr:polysaccharide biosynthesis/export family protein [Acidobacteriota bacterium]
MKFIFLQTLLLGSALALAPVAGLAQSASDGAASASPAQSDAGSANKPHDDSFVIGNDDLLAISVWKEAELTKSVPVRSDGKISLPLVGEIQASGRTPAQLEKEITDKLKNFITTPEVTVVVEKVNSRKYNVLGEVTKPGSYLLTTETTVMDAIAAAGGFRDFAKKSGVYVLRKSANGQEEHLKFNYKDFVKGKNTAQNVKLEPNDTIIVP